MAQTTIEQFATELKMPASALLEQLQKAGVTKSTLDDGVSVAGFGGGEFGMQI